MRVNGFKTLVFAVFFVLLSPGWAAAGNICLAAINQAEALRELPRNILTAIGLTESGRRDPQTNVFAPWPWTINAEGKGYFFNSKQEAIEAVQRLQQDGVRSIDVGCMQVNLLHHADAFRDLNQAFDPAANVAYAAQYLQALHRQHNSWTTAIGNYHSATPEFHNRYRQKILATLEKLNSDPKKIDVAVYRGKNEKTKVAQRLDTDNEELSFRGMSIFQADAARRAAVLKNWEARKARQAKHVREAGSFQLTSR